MNILLYIIIGLIVLLFVLVIVYFFLFWKLRRINSKIFKYRKEENIKQKNILIVYQPSKHKTTIKIKELIKKEVLNKGYGYVASTLCKEDEDYSKYEYVIFVAPVYFGEVNVEFVNKLKKNKIDNLLIIYNGLNNMSNREDDNISKISFSKYKKLKLYTQDIDNVKEFIQKEIL